MDTEGMAMDVQKRVIRNGAASKDCFVCTMRVMEQDLLAARAMNCEVALANFERLKSTCKAYGYAESSRMKWSACSLHFGNKVAVIEAVWNVIELFMASLEELSQRQRTLAGKLLHLAYFFTSHNITVRRHSFSFSLTGISTSISSSELPSREFRRLLKAPYSVQSPDERTEYHNKQHIVWWAIMDSQEHLLSALLRYGVMFLPATQFTAVDLVEMDGALGCLDDHSERRFISPSQNAVLDSYRRELRWPLHRVIIVLRVLIILSYEVCETPIIDLSEGEGSRLEDSREGSSSSSGYFRCLRRAFETIPEPYVTSEELRRVLQVVFDDIDERREARIDGALAMFEKWYPEGAGPLAPRALQHLSRCQLRQNLRLTKSLPHGIRRLVLPNKIRKYIVLEE